ncbi:MAG: hypothetical protein V1712_04180 [Patescibacteria group bacterium]
MDKFEQSTNKLKFLNGAEFIISLAEGFAVGWLLLFLLEQLHMGLVSVIWNLNLLLIITFGLLVVSIFFNNKSGKINSLAALIFAIMLTLVTWQLVPLAIFKFVALAAGIAIWLIFNNVKYD